MLALVGYGAGVPCTIAYIMVMCRARIVRDQKLWLAGHGDSAESNPDYSVRRRFAKLYQVRAHPLPHRTLAFVSFPATQDFTPEVFAWRLVLLARKLCLVCIVELTGKNAMFQASLSLAVLAVAYGLHAKYHPFVTSLAQASALAEHGKSASAGAETVVASDRARRLSRRLGRRDSEIIQDLAVSGARKTLANAEVLLDFNVLETTLLCTSTAVLLGGMLFESSRLLPGSAAYVFLTVCVGGVMIGSVAVFAFMVAVETRRTCRRPAQHRAVPSASSFDLAASRGRIPMQSRWQRNPLHVPRSVNSVAFAPGDSGRANSQTGSRKTFLADAADGSVAELHTGTSSGARSADIRGALAAGTR